MAKYKKRADGRYCTTITVGYSDEGKRILKAVYGRSIKELDAKLSDIRSLQNKGVVLTDNKTSLKEWADKWLDAYKKGVEYNTYEMYSTCVKKHIKTADIADTPLIKIKTVDLQRIVNAKGQTRTAEIVVLTLRQMFNQAVENDLLYKNPAAGLKKPSRQVKPKRALKDIENKAIEKAELTDRERAFVYLGKYAGLRRGEILALTKGDINLKDRTVTVNKTVVFKKNTGEIKHMPKSDAGFRAIPMPTKLYSFITNYINTLDGLCLFTTQSGDICTKSSFRKMWESIIKELDITACGKKSKKIIKEDNSKKTSKKYVPKLITDLTSHILRHDYATSLYYAEVDIKTAQKLLGHSDIKMTLQIYTHLEQDNEDVTNKLDNLYSGKKKTSDSQMIVKTENTNK